METNERIPPILNEELWFEEQPELTADEQLELACAAATDFDGCYRHSGFEVVGYETVELEETMRFTTHADRVFGYSIAHASLPYQNTERVHRAALLGFALEDYLACKRPNAQSTVLRCRHCDADHAARYEQTDRDTCSHEHHAPLYEVLTGYYGLAHNYMAENERERCEYDVAVSYWLCHLREQLAVALGDKVIPWKGDFAWADIQRIAAGLTPFHPSM